jgi:TnpA family transposase
MPGQFLTAAERERLERFPGEVSPMDLIAFFTLSESDRQQIPVTSAASNRLGFALQLCALRYLGFAPDDLSTAPAGVIRHVAEQLDVPFEGVSDYGKRPQTRTDHLRVIVRYLGFRRATPRKLEALGRWLVERALEHDKPTLLLQLACEKLHQEKVLRPGVTSLERLVVAARQEAEQETYRRLRPLLVGDRKALLDGLLVVDEARGRSPLAWLQQGTCSNSPKAILAAIERREFLKRHGVDRWTLDAIPPNRRKFLAGLARRSTNQALQRMSDERRYPILAAFLHQSVVEIADDLIDTFDRCLAQSYARASRDLEDYRISVARETNEQVRLFRDLAGVVLDPEIGDHAVRAAIFARIPEATLRGALDAANRIARPIEDHGFDFLEDRYTYLRQFSPAFLETFTFRSHRRGDPLLEGLDVIRRLNGTGQRILPEDLPLGFVPSRWRPYILEAGSAAERRHYYELCVLWELRAALRSGDVWLEGSRRYADPETYLIPRARWPEVRPEVCRQVGIGPDGVSRLERREAELRELLPRIDEILAREEKVRIERGELVVSPLEAEDVPESVEELATLVDERLPLVDLSELLIEVDGWTGFSRCLEHAGGGGLRSPDLQLHLYASILAQGCNLGLTRMAQIADVTYRQLAWCTNWHLREETLKAAVARIVDFQYHQPLSRHWGGGTLSSSDGQRFPVSGKIPNATALPRYFGHGRGVTFYTWTSDQFSQYGTKVIPATVRDATYVLDEILDNETELPILEHTTDTAGYTELVFALFDLLGLQFSPRIRDLGDQHLYRIDPGRTYPHLRGRLKGRIHRDRIVARWEDLLRVAGSLKLGWVTASLLISKLQSYPRQNTLTRALQEYGRLIKTIFILRYLESEDYRRRINAQLNKGESLHSLREFLFFANRGKVRRKQEEEQTHQALCLNLLTNAVVAWNTVYMAAAIEQIRREGHPVQDADLVHLSPARYEHINPYGKYRFAVDEELNRTGLRPLRRP